MGARLASIVLTVCCCVPATLGAAAERFAAEVILSGGPNEALVTVFEKDGDSKKVVWSRTAPYPGAQAGRFFTTLPKNILVSEDGRHVVVRFMRQTGDDNAWLFVSREGDPARIPLGAFEDFLGARLVANQGFYQPGPVGVLDLIQDGRYYAWFPGPNQWVEVDFDDPKLALASAAATQGLSQWAKNRALTRVQEHQPGPLRRLMKPVRAKAAEHLPGFSPPKQLSVGHDDELLGSYAFLAVQKDTDGEKYLRGLLETPIPEAPPTFSMFDQHSVTAVFRSADRHLGERLWDWWSRSTNGQPGLALESPDFLSFNDHSKPRHFTEIRGEVRLAIPVPAKFGGLRVYLIPDSVPKGQWQDAPDVTSLGVAHHGMLPDDLEIEQMHFRFTTIAPGKYRLKAVWDRRPPQAPWNERAIPGPGDYESAETAPFTAAVGEIVAIPILECTNRLAGADEYYAADETWARVGPTRADEQIRELASRHLANARHVICEAPDMANDAANIPALRLIRAAMVDGKLESEFEAAYLQSIRAGWQFPQFELRDEHGCLFKPRSTEPQMIGMQHALFMPRFPVRPPPGRIQLVARIDDLDALTNSLLVTVPAASKQNIEPVALPATRTIDGIAFELSAIDRRLGPQFRVLDSSGAWMLERAEIVDSHGQISSSFEEFCRREELFVVRATFAPLLGQPLPEKTWHVPIGEWPKDGEFRALNVVTNLGGVKFEIAAIGGKGSFSYRNGRVLEAFPDLRGWDDGAWPPLQSVADFVRLKPANHRDPVHRDELIVRLPHVALRAEGLRPEHRFRLVEEREKPWRSLRDLEPGGLPPTEPWYLPLNRVTRAQTGGLTVELASAVTVEFPVRVPPAEPETAASRAGAFLPTSVGQKSGPSVIVPLPSDRDSH